MKFLSKIKLIGNPIPKKMDLSINGCNNCIGSKRNTVDDELPVSFPDIKLSSRDNYKKRSVKIGSMMERRLDRV